MLRVGAPGDSGCSAIDPVDERGRCHDFRATKVTKGEEVMIARDDVVGPAGEREFEELVVLRVAADRYALGNLDQIDASENAPRNTSRSPGVMYAASLGRRSVRISSAVVSAEARSTPWTCATSNARRGVDRGNASALTMTLVSSTKRCRVSALIHDVFELLLREAALLHPSSDDVHDLAERSRLGQLRVFGLDPDGDAVIGRELPFLPPRGGKLTRLDGSFVQRLHDRHHSASAPHVDFNSPARVRESGVTRRRISSVPVDTTKWGRAAPRPRRA